MNWTLGKLSPWRVSYFRVTCAAPGCSHRIIQRARWNIFYHRATISRKKNKYFIELSPRPLHETKFYFRYGRLSTNKKVRKFLTRKRFHHRYLCIQSIQIILLYWTIFNFIFNIYFIQFRTQLKYFCSTCLYLYCRRWIFIYNVYMMVILLCACHCILTRQSCILNI